MDKNKCPKMKIPKKSLKKIDTSLFICRDYIFDHNYKILENPLHDVVQRSLSTIYNK
jgi:hypothetical protein